MRTFQHKKRLTSFGLFSLFVSLIFLFSCVSISPATVNLSADVGERLNEMERLHILAVQRYFDSEIEKVENFLTNTWEPLFLRNFLGTSGVLQMLQNVSPFDQDSRDNIKTGIKSYLSDPAQAQTATDALCDALAASRAGDGDKIRTTLGPYIAPEKMDAAVIYISSLLGTDEPARIMLDFTDAAHKEMQKQREELLNPIYKAKDEALRELRDAYSDIARGQSIITGRLEAANKVSAETNSLMKKVGVDGIAKNLSAKMLNITNKVDSGLSLAKKALDGNPAAGNAFDELKSKLNQLTDPASGH